MCIAHMSASIHRALQDYPLFCVSFLIAFTFGIISFCIWLLIAVNYTIVAELFSMHSQILSCTRVVSQFQ